MTRTNPQLLLSYSQLNGAFRYHVVYCFGFMACNFTVLLHSHCSHRHSFQLQQAVVFRKKKQNRLLKNKSTIEPDTIKLDGEQSGAFDS